MTTPKAVQDASETRVEFPDNRLLIDLCGAFDSHLAQIEHQLEVQILRRGNQLVLIGDAAAQGGAEKVLLALYGRLENGQVLEAGDIDGEMRMSAPSKAQRSAPRLKPGPVEIMTRQKLVVPRTDAQKAYVQALFQHEMVFGIGPAGTGKTYLAVAAAVNMFTSGHVDKIILSRPAVEAGERLGFLPGDMKDKVDPYMLPLYDALNDFLTPRQVGKLIEDKRIEIAPLAFMRGRTLSNAFVVLDEAQNATKMQMKMFLTRLGEGSRMVVTGDRTQIDLAPNVPSGLKDAEGLLQGIKQISFNYFTSKDVVRHKLVGKIIEAYDKADGVS